MTVGRRLRLGVVGAGVISSSPEFGWLAGIQSLRDRVDVVAIADPLLDRARRAADTFLIPHVFASVDDMLDRVEVDGIANITPIPLHGEVCRKVLEAGKHLVTEKPFATSIEDADAIVELASAKGLIVVCCPTTGIDPFTLEARRLVREGSIGRIAFARVRASNAGPAAGGRGSDPTWFYQRGAGPLFDMGVYGLHTITMILGPAKRVVALSGITEPTRVVQGGPYKGDVIEVTADDNTLLMLDFGGSTYAVVDATFNVSAARGPQVEIFGREGTINLELGAAQNTEAEPLEIFRVDAVPGLSGWIRPNLGAITRVAESRRRSGRAYPVAHLLDCLDEIQVPPLTVEHARHVLEIMLKAQESAREGRALDLTTTFSTEDPGTRFDRARPVARQGGRAS
jgi:predicted dehydrogenase